jgi:hypothetical protein
MFFIKQFEAHETFRLQPIVFLCESLALLVKFVSFAGDSGSEFIIR